MATFQDVRGYFEAQAMADLKTAGIADNLIFFDNVGETPGQADQSYAVVSLSFTTPVQDTLACEGIEDLRGQYRSIATRRKIKAASQGKTFACK